MADGERPKEKIEKNNNTKSNFSTTANIFVRNILSRFLNLIFVTILSNHLIKQPVNAFKATSVYHSGGCAPWTPFNFTACSTGYVTQKTVRGKGKVRFYSLAIFSFGNFFH